MSKIVSITYISGNVIDQIKYNDFIDLSDQLKLLIIHYDSDIFISLLINEVVINDFNIININILSTL